MANQYQILIPDQELEKLRQKLELTKFPDELDSSNPWLYGAPLADVKRLASFWKDGFDWREQEKKLNELPNYRTKVDVEGFGSVEIHYLHQPSDVKEAIPLLFCHGWPGSYLEVTKLLPLLKGDVDSPAFHVVAPSLPNFGWSEAIKKPGFDLTKYAETLNRLMLQLGYDRYVTQGGDWGFFITRAMGKLYPSNVLASHINMIIANPPKWKQNPLLAFQHALASYSQSEQQGFKRSQWYSKQSSGYNLQQRTKPQTLGYALADSPVALLAWIYEKLHDWTDSYPWTDDEILTWVSIYWFSAAGPAASVRIYYEASHSPWKSLTNGDAAREWNPHVKLGLAHFPKEIGHVPRTWARTLGEVVFESEWDRGGHFAAWERPEAIAGDLQKMFGKEGPCYSIVKGRSGYKKTNARL